MAVNIIAKRSLGLWALLCFQAGFLNSLGFLSVHSFVSHVTGFGSQIGINLGTGQYHVALELFFAPLTFIFGGFVASLFTEMKIVNGKKGNFIEVALIQAVLITALAGLGIQGIFGEFGEPLTQDRDFILLHALCFICGMQNACYSIFSQTKIKTTHLTGLSTDIGVNLPKILFKSKLPEEEVHNERRRTFMRIGNFLAFTTGATLSAFMLNQYGFYSFAIPTLTAWIAVVYLNVGFKKEI